MTALDACRRARAAWEKQAQQQQLEFDPDALSGESAPRFSHGLSTEGCRSDSQGRESAFAAHASLTAAAHRHAPGQGCATALFNRHNREA